MLVLSRKIGEKITIGDNVTLEILEICGNRVKIGITAPPEVEILRGELVIDLDNDDEDGTMEIVPAA